METILDRIIREKQQEVIQLKNHFQAVDPIQQSKKSFIQKLQHADEIAIIAEYKRSSPSKGVINYQIGPAEQTELYEKHGASAVSVLTDQTFFKGSYEDLRIVRDAVELPILCKDFMIDPVQIDYAAANGADLILLIAAALEESRLASLYQYALEKGLEVLMEVHNQEELEKALKTSARLIGINNRNLKTFQVTLEVTSKLAETVRQSGAFLISESGIHTQADAVRVRDAGANGILVGEALMTSPDMHKAFRDFRLPLKKEAEK